MSPLQRHAVLHSEDIDEFRASVSRFLTPHVLTPAGGGHSIITTDLARADLGPLSVVYAQHSGAELNVRLTEQVSYYDINLSLGGQNWLSCDGDSVLVDRATAGIISPRMLAEMKLSDGYRQLHVRFERYALERQLERLLDRAVTAPIRFESQMDLRAPAAASWAKAVRLLVEDLERPRGLSESAAGENPWTDFLMTGLLLAQPHSYSALLEEKRAGALRPAPLKHAMDLIERSPETILTVDILAAGAGVSPRSLQRHFRDYVGLSPREYVQKVRLARAHEDLRSAVPGSGITVADVALRWGFTHVPRFAGVYQEHYGVAPSVTLRDTAKAFEPGK